jgi:flavin reductase (DIM6/NTAB) family NADH-FMN oxidoreductase RutF
VKEQLVPSRKTISNFLVPFPSVVTTKNLANVPNAITMSYFSAIHWDPPSVVLSISSKHQSNRNLKENPIFTINVLENDVQSIELANLAGSTSGVEKLKKVESYFFDEPSKVNSKDWPPIIHGTIIALHGVIIQDTDYNGQVLYIGEIKEAKMIESLHTIDKTEKNLMWKAIDELVMSNSDIYSQVY